MTDRERIAVLEQKMDVVMAFESRISRMERVLIFVGGMAFVSGLGSAPTLVSILTGG